MAYLQYPLALIVTLGVLVTFHELGHYLVARCSGVRILRFCVGFGRPIWSRMDRRGTEWAVAVLPLGGYVRMLDEREPDPATVRRPGDVAFNDLSAGWRIAIAAAGPLANFLLAILVYWALFVVGNTTVAPMLGAVPADSPGARAGLVEHAEIVAVDGNGTPTWQSVSMALAARLGDSGDIRLALQPPGAEAPVERRLPIEDWHRGVDEPDLLGSLGIVPAVPAVLGRVIPGDPADRAGLRPGDRIAAIDGEPVDWSALVDRVQAAPGERLMLTVERDGSRLELPVTAAVRGSDGEAQGYLGIGPNTNTVRYGLLSALPRGLGETWEKTVLTLHLMQKMITGQVSVKNLSGPITIAKVAGDSAQAGWRFFLSVLALLSISLGVLNLLPIPILDGGHILFCVVELLRGRPVSERVQLLGTQVGLALVGGLMLLALYNDIARLF